MLFSGTHRKWSLSRHDDLRSLNADTQIIPQGHSDTAAHWHRNTETLNIHRVHGRAAQRGCHCVSLEMTGKPKVSWRVTGTEQLERNSTVICLRFIQTSRYIWFNTPLSGIITHLNADIDRTGPAALQVAEQDVLWTEVSVDDAFAL